MKNGKAQKSNGRRRSINVNPLAKYSLNASPLYEVIPNDNPAEIVIVGGKGVV